MGLRPLLLALLALVVSACATPPAPAGPPTTTTRSATAVSRAPPPTTARPTRRFAVPYPLANDASGRTWARWRVPYQPVTVLVDNQGRIAERFDGGTTGGTLRAALSYLARECPVATASSQVTDTVDAALTPSAEQWTALGPCCAAHFHPPGWPARAMGH
jgi:hypothetical protein